MLSYDRDVVIMFLVSLRLGCRILFFRLILSIIVERNKLRKYGIRETLIF